jgi:hypothetical protein
MTDGSLSPFALKLFEPIVFKIWTFKKWCGLVDTVVQQRQRRAK